MNLVDRSRNAADGGNITLNPTVVTQFDGKAIATQLIDGVQRMNARSSNVDLRGQLTPATKEASAPWTWAAPFALVGSGAQIWSQLVDVEYQHDHVVLPSLGGLRSGKVLIKLLRLRVGCGDERRDLRWRRADVHV